MHSYPFEGFSHGTRELCPLSLGWASHHFCQVPFLRRSLASRIYHFFALFVPRVMSTPVRQNVFEAEESDSDFQHDVTWKVASKAKASEGYHPGQCILHQKPLKPPQKKQCPLQQNV